jgi:hypothetical protein
MKWELSAFFFTNLLTRDTSCFPQLFSEGNLSADSATQAPPPELSVD